MDLVKVLTDLVLPMADDKEGLRVKQMESLNDKEVLLYVYASKEDVSRLIGRQGQMANSIRQMMSVAGRDSNKKITIKFESYN